MKLTVAESTMKNYQVCSRRFLDAFAEFTPQQIKPSHVARFLDDHRKTPSMANLLHSFMRNVFKRAVRWGVIDADPSRDIEKFKTESRDRLISDDEWRLIKANASPVLSCLMDIAYITGQRIGDVMAIRHADISDEGLYVKQKKTSARRLLVMTPDLRAALDDANALNPTVKAPTIFHKGDGKPLSYNTIYGHWRRACAAAGVENAHFHDIRANAATEADEAGMDSKALLGHASETVHKRYLRSKKVTKAQPLPAKKA
jgi:integrase